MAQTAVEFLVEQLCIEHRKTLVNQAKEMEKQQQGYSEEDMTEYAMFVLLNKLITPKEWFKQFKNK